MPLPLDQKTMRATLIFVCIAATSACIGYERRSTLSPTATGIAALLGNWTSANVVPTVGSCTDFKWNVTEQTGSTARGTFSATCAGDLRVSGTANATLNGSNVTWDVVATATVANLPACPVTLSGTAELGVDSIRVPYSGQTCLGPVSGVEVLRKN
jgi:hypothetical protein